MGAVGMRCSGAFAEGRGAVSRTIGLSEGLAVRENTNTGGLILECLVDDDAAMVFLTTQECAALRRYLNFHHEMIEEAKRRERDN